MYPKKVGSPSQTEVILIKKFTEKRKKKKCDFGRHGSCFLSLLTSNSNSAHSSSSQPIHADKKPKTQLVIICTYMESEQFRCVQTWHITNDHAIHIRQPRFLIRPAQRSRNHRRRGRRHRPEVYQPPLGPRLSLTSRR